MEINTLQQNVQDILKKGKIDEALDKLIEGLAEDQRFKLQKDAVQLKTIYAQARYEYEVKGLLPRSEFDLTQNKTLNGIQAILDKLESAADIRHPATVHRWWIGGPLIVLLLVVLGIWWKVQQSNSHDSKSSAPEEQKTGDSSVLVETRVDSIENYAKQEVAEPLQESATHPNLVAPAPPEEPSQTKVTCSFRLILNSNMADARVFVDNQPAQVIAGHGTQIRIIETTPGMHEIILRNNKFECKFNHEVIPNGKAYQPSTCN